MPPSDVLVVTVGFNSAQALAAHCRVVPQPSVRFVVVDNASKDDTAAVALALGAEVIRAPRNEGFGRACNRGARANRGEEWVVFLNPDVSITADALLSLVRNAPADAVALAPLLTDSAGIVQRDVARTRPTVWSLAGLYLLSARSERGDRSAWRRLTASTQRHVDVEVTSGACLAVRRSEFDAAGCFPAWLFLNYEDVYLCTRLRAIGRIVVDRDVVAFHAKAHSSTDVSAWGRALETARAVSAYAAAEFSYAGWVLVVLAVIVGTALRAARRPREITRLGGLVTTMTAEGQRIRNGEAFDADRIFV